MAGNSVIQVPPDSTGKRVDCISLDEGGVAVYRQKMIITGASGSSEVVATSMSAPAASAVGLVVRQAGAIDVNALAISGTALIAGNVIAVISGTATVAGSVVISGTAIVAGNVNISATALVAGVVGLTAGTANIGHLNHISRTVVAAIASLYVSTNPPSASRGPRMVPLSASAATTLVAAPGAGFAIFVTGIQCSNPTNINSAVRLGTSGTPGNVTMMLALSGGGFVAEYHPPWKLSTNEALIASMKPSTSTVYANVHFFVASADAL